LKSFFQFYELHTIGKPYNMSSVTSSVAAGTAASVAAKKVEKDCIICQDKFSEEKIETRACGHTTCRECDGEWRKRASIVCTKVDVRDAQGHKQKVNKYHVSSTCPMCRAEDTYANFKLRSKESLATELSIALGMLYRSNRTKLEMTSPAHQRAAAAPPRPPAFQMDDLTRQVIDQLIAEGQIQGPAVAVRPVAAPVAVAPRPVAAPVAVAPRPVAAPVVVAPRPIPVPVAAAPRPIPAPVVAAPRPVPVPVAAAPHHNYGILMRPPGRPRQPRDDVCANGALFRCVTTKTKLKCPRCNVPLCRTCKNQCPHCPAI
jgi:hypothetical protein